MQAASGSGDGGLSGEVLLRRAGEVPLTPRRKIHGRERNAFEPSFESIAAGSAIAHRWCTHGESLSQAHPSSSKDDAPADSPRPSEQAGEKESARVPQIQRVR